MPPHTGHTGVLSLFEEGQDTVRSRSDGSRGIAFTPFRRDTEREYNTTSAFTALQRQLNTHSARESGQIVRDIVAKSAKMGIAGLGSLHA
jgi:hypothetical protein